jgi:hypothetical protein
MDNTILDQINSELAAILEHTSNGSKGGNIVLTFRTKTGKEISLHLSDKGEFFKPLGLSESGILTIPSDKSNISTDQQGDTQTDTLHLSRTNIAVGDIESFKFNYDRNVKSTIVPESGE